jgi:flagellar FliL protein
MAAKADTKEAAPAVPAVVEKGASKDKEDKGAAPAAAPASSPGPKWLGWAVAAAAVVLAPALSWAVADYVLLPRLEKRLAAPAAVEEAPPPPAESQPSDAKAKPAPPSYQFSNVVVNLAGTMGTRYLKTSFIVTGTDAGLANIFEGEKARLTDVTLNVLSSLTLADLEEPGSKNVLREKLVAAYNQTLGRKVADQVYFSDFVVQ